MSLFKIIAVFGILAAISLPSVPPALAQAINAQDREKLDNLLVIVSEGKQDKLKLPVNPAQVPAQAPAPTQAPTAAPIVKPDQIALPKKQPTKTLTKDFVLSDKSITKKIGQMVMVGFRGTSTKNPGVRAVMQQIKEGSIGGVMLMKHNIVSLGQVKKLTAALRRAASAGKKPPPLISVDQEGGLVQRLRFNQFPSAKAIATYSLANAAKVYGNLACEVRSAGINVNFGPVADVDVQGLKNPVIGRLKRSYSPNPTTVRKYAQQFVQAHKNYGIITTAKHFPGHGSSLKDSHKGFTAIPRWNRKIELAPFKALANGPPEQSVDMVMVGHLYNKSWDAPATLSKKAISGLLRKEVNFRGVVITDDMEMGAIRKNYDWDEAIVAAVSAGNDILLYSNTVTSDPFLGPKIRNTIAGAVCKKSASKSTPCISTRQIEASFDRILKMKYNQARRAAYNRKRQCIGLRKKKLRQASIKRKTKKVRKAKRRTARRSTKQTNNFN